MAIKKIKISNFKSFKDLEIKLDKFNVLIGANASGKSNFIQIFKFLRDITNYGLDNAISMQGGIEYLRNVNVGSSENFSLEVVFDQKFVPALKITGKGLIEIEPYETIYKFALKFKKRGQGFEIVEDKLTQKCVFFQRKNEKGTIPGKEKVGEGEIIYSVTNGEINVDLIPKELGVKKENIVLSFLREKKLESKTLLIEHPLHIFYWDIFHLFSDSLSIYDFDPKLPKKGTPITGKAELEEDGSNLAIVLKNILENKDKKRKFSNLVKELLPFVDNLDVEKFADKSLLFKLREIYTKKHYLPSFLISDGTINITALIIALYFNKKPLTLTIIEEPERNIHPYLISKVIGMMKDASQKKQIIVTTHNPEMVKHAEVENILLISRDKEGFSVISKPYEKEKVKKFLQNEPGIEELYVQNLLEQ